MRCGDKLREAGIADGDEAARRHAVGDVAEFPRPQLGKIAQHRLFQQFRVELRDAIDGMAADARKMCHAHVARSAFINEREPRDAGMCHLESRARTSSRKRRLISKTISRCRGSSVPKRSTVHFSNASGSRV